MDASVAYYPCCASSVRGPGAMAQPIASGRLRPGKESAVSIEFSLQALACHCAF